MYEFNSGRLTNIARHHIFRDALFSYNKKPSYGRLTFDTSLPDASVRYEIVNIDGEVVNAITVYKSQLMHKWIDIYCKDWYFKKEVQKDAKE
ncbi:MAG: hypothetical protein HRT61_09115 [Ekhidna sp.]|nr:hypothetical protein [Ekhidna sp.]